MTQPKSPNLGLISNPPLTEEPGATAPERRRLPRLSLSDEQFRAAENAPLGIGGKIFPIADLTSSGMALRVLEREDLQHFPIATRIDGTLNLRRQKYPVHATVRNLRGDLIGFEFVDLAPETVQALSRYLDPEALGRDLKPLPSSESNSTLWYHGPSGTDLLFWRGVDGQYRKFALYVLGTYIQWDQDFGISTGSAEGTTERSEVRGVVSFDTLALSVDARPDQAKLKIAKTLVMSSNLPQDLKAWITRQIGGNHGS